MARKPAKSESLTIRLDPKNRFMLEFVARLRGQTITTVVERALADAATRAVIKNEYGSEDFTWRDYWHVVEGWRALKMAREPELHPTFEEERRDYFTRKFWQFFYMSPDAHIHELKLGNVEVLWPRIDEFMGIDDAFKAQNLYAAGDAMLKALKDAQIKVLFDWPPKPKARSDFDDDIPF